MTQELLTRIRQGIVEYKMRHNCTSQELAEDFIRKTAFSPLTNSFRFEVVEGWNVIEEDDLGEINIHKFEDKSEAENKVKQLYPYGIKPSDMRLILYNAPVNFIPKAGVQERSQKNLSMLSNSDAIQAIVDAGALRIADTISDINRILKDESETGVMNNVNPATIDDAINHRKSLQEHLEMRRAETVFSLIRDSDDGEKYLVKEAAWRSQNMATSGEALIYPDPKKMSIDVTSSKKIQYSTLLALDRFLSNEMGVSVATVLAKVHPILAEAFSANTEWRPSLSGSPGSSGDGEFSFGKHLGSNLREMIHEMAHSGFDIQPIFDKRIGGNCIGMVKLSDVAGLMSDDSFNLRPDSTVSELQNYGPEGIILPPPPQIDASSDLSVAGNILKHGNDAIIVKFDPNNWFGNKTELEAAKEILAPGYHIMTSHDIIAYRLI
jgi:hypothetical protein